MLTGTYNGVRATVRDEAQREEQIARYSRVVADESVAKPTRDLAQALVMALMLAE